MTGNYTVRIFAIYLGCFISGCIRQTDRKDNTLFHKVSADSSHLDFENKLEETDEFNIIEYLYFYNGGGVAIGDINNDGLPDVYFSSNQHANKLYLNKGNFVFEDITDKAGVAGAGNWTTGVTMADVNGDGFLDIFVCGVGNYKSFNGRNQLLINNGDLTFTDETDAYGLTFQGFSTQAIFFDYDNDGDIDVYLLNHSVHTARSYGDISLRYQSDSLAGDRLYRNDTSPGGKPHFTDVTKKAGILNSQIGYGLGVGVSDLNLDGFPDIYISNDFHENDYLYINQGDGTFKQQMESSFPHTSRFSMGNDIGDVNNDGWPDIITLDMLPRDERVIKTTAGEDPYEIFEYKLDFGYHYQMARNALQLNRGPLADKSLIYSDIAPFAGIEATDWSWAPLLADFDNDGYKDLFISNGIARRPNDLDYINFISQDTIQKYFNDKQFISRMPKGIVPNAFFRNSRDLKFEDVAKQWIGTTPTLSNGAAYADLDNDGDLDLIVNNIDDTASLYRNDLQQQPASWLGLKLNGSGLNRFGIGTKAFVYVNGQIIYDEQMPTRGWMSSVDYTLHFGLGKNNQVDSIIVIWPDRKFQTLYKISSNQLITINQADANKIWSYAFKPTQPKPLLEEHEELAFRHKENDFVAFNVERLIPHMLSTQGPGIAVGDLNGDGQDDFFVCGAKGQPGAVFLQRRDGTFEQMREKSLELDFQYEDVDATIFDANGDGKADLVVASGGEEYPSNSEWLQPRLYFNDGKGNLSLGFRKLPQVHDNLSCVQPCDYDGDGDIDLFIGGRVVTGKYGEDPQSYLFENDGTGNFTDATRKLLGNGNRTSFGMVTDAVWTDLNKDGRPDLIIAGEWMPITVLIQDNNGIFQDQTKAFGLDHTNGWWNTLMAADFDGDGDMDLMAGNFGLNSRLRASPDQPVEIFISDIDGNGVAEPIMTYYNQGIQHPFLSKDQLVRQVPPLKRKFLKYSDYGNVSLENIMPQKESNGVIHKKAEMFASVYFENCDNKSFVAHPLPTEAQFFPIFAICPTDINGDGKLDVLLGGNLYAVQPDLGRYDAGYGLVLLGDGRGGFQSVDQQTSGFVVKGETRDIEPIAEPNGHRRFLVGRNNDSVLLFK